MNKLTYKFAPMVSIYSLAHFLVDFACAFLMFRYVIGSTNGLLCILIYNFCAFALQMPIGIIADKLNRNYIVAITGCVFAATAFVLTAFPIAATVVVGLGNAMFHIGGGIDILNISEKKLSALGIFVSPGAFGIYYGTLLGKGGDFAAIAIPLVLIAAGGLIFVILRKFPRLQNVEFELPPVNNTIIMCVACFFFVVCLRSFAGLSMNFDWKGTGQWGFILLCAVVFGKTLGGIAADLFGIRKTAAISLGAAVVLFLLAAVPVAGVGAVLLFNMTMPITLWAMAKVFPAAKGFAFGTLTFALFIGFLPVYLGVDIAAISDWLFAAIAGGTLVILLLGLHKMRKKL